MRKRFLRPCKMKKSIEDVLVKELDEIESIDFVTSLPHLQDKTVFIAHDIRNEFPEESQQLLEISEAIEDMLKQTPPDEFAENFITIKRSVALILKQILEIDD